MVLKILQDRSKMATPLKEASSVIQLRLRNGDLISSTSPLIMGIINLSPDSFFKPHATLNDALHTAELMVAEGADILDIGTIATNPSVSVNWNNTVSALEVDKVISTITAIKKNFDVLLSVDTSDPIVMRAAIQAGADIINDQCALREDEALAVVASAKMPVCLMHSFVTARQPGSENSKQLLNRIKNDLTRSVSRCEDAGILRDRIIIDVGFGQGNYGKNADENFYLLTHLFEFTEMGFPILSGWSRKSMIGDILELTTEERLFGSIAADALAVYHGASIIRTHDVKASRDAVRIAVAARRQQ